MSKTNKLHAIAYTVLGIIIVVMAIAWYSTAKNRKRLDIAVNNSYDRAFFDLSDYVGEIDVLLTKAQLASISNEIFMQAAEAKSCCGELPNQNINLEKSAKFLSQVGDYTYVLSQNLINGLGISDE